MPRFATIILILFLLCSTGTAVYAKHIKGGWIQYEYAGTGLSATSSFYKVTINLYASCQENGPTDQVYLGVFDKSKNEPILDKRIPVSEFKTINKAYYDPCLNLPPAICYRIYSYSTTLELENNEAGYILSAQDALRSANIVNIQNSSNRGITFMAIIPGVIDGQPYYTNSSPYFQFRDTVIICYNAPFTYQFEATDQNGDSLSYDLGDGLDVRSPSGNTSSVAPASPPYPPVRYENGYSGKDPMGSGINIDPVTGLITGTAPSITGDYVLAVYVNEYRNGVLLGSTKKELQVNVGNCSLTAAALKPSYLNCNDFSFDFQNESTAPSVFAYNWDFGVTSINTDTSSQPMPSYTYPDTGSFQLRLIVRNTGGCQDTATAAVKIYPGFVPGFQVRGSCFESPFQFNDLTQSRYGIVNYWRWNFGDVSTLSDTSTKKNDTYKYANTGARTISFEVRDNNGCSEMLTREVMVSDKPIIDLPFRDTLLCSVDSLQLTANSIGTFSWSPDANMLNAQTATPTVFPKNTTTYYLHVRDQTCENTDSIKVKVVDRIEVDAGDHINLCRTDSARLNPVSDGLTFSWTPAIGLSDAKTKQPNASPTTQTTYYVTANAGSCIAHDSLTVFVSPYPVAYAGTDTTICYGATAQLHGSYTGAFFHWQQAAGIDNTQMLHTLASPVSNTAFVLVVSDTTYCKKPVADTVWVNVYPKVEADAGRDTSIVMGQPLQLQASGGARYEWYPPDGLNDATAADPTLITSTRSDGAVYHLTAYSANNCTGTDDIVIKVFSTGTEIFVPSGFTPNADGKNDILKPILVGIKSLNYFRVYNRYGKLIYATSQAENGWNGTVNGQPQASGAYVYVAEGIDYTGKTILRKGTTVLIR